MQQDDLVYLCTTIGNLSGIPVRLFAEQTQVFYHDLVNLPKDPMALYRDDIWALQTHVGYFITPFFNYYGVVNSAPYKIVIGPTRQVAGQEQDLRAIAFELDIPREDVEPFVSAMRNIVRMPLESVMQMLCTINFALNHEKLQLGDITIVDAEQTLLRRQMAAALSDVDLTKVARQDRPQRDVYTSYSAEQALMRYVSRGQTAALREWMAAAPAIRPGLLSADQLRQLKNVFIVSATLCSRAAIRGALNEEDAFSLSDAYIQKCELLKTPEQIMNLQYCMILDYTERVERIRSGRQPSALAAQVANYVQRHLSEPITVDALAKALYLSRSRLSARFKGETGQTLVDFILKEKTEEAKRLLRYTDKSATAIGAYLGFSSLGHFSRVFKKYTGKTPSQYREKYAS